MRDNSHILQPVSSNWVLKSRFYHEGDAAPKQLLRKASLSLESFKIWLNKAPADPVLATTLLHLEGQARWSPTFPLNASMTPKWCRYSTLRKARTAARNPSQRLRTYTLCLSLSLWLLCQILVYISDREPITSDRVTAAPDSLLQTLQLFRSSQVPVWTVIRTFVQVP